MSELKSVKLFQIERYLRDRNANALYDAFEYIGDSISTQDLIMAEEDFNYRAYLVNIILDEVRTWNDAEIDKIINHLRKNNEQHIQR